MERGCTHQRRGSKTVLSPLLEKCASGTRIVDRESMIIGFEESDSTYAKLLIKLKHEGITKREFFRGIVNGFLEEDPQFMRYLLDLKKRKNLYTQTKQKILDKERKVSYNTEKQLGLSKDEVNDLFDMFDEELGV
jgi:hypothetical protein